MIEAYKKYFINYTNFKGRSSRSDYWWVILANFIIGLAFGCLGEFGETLSTLYSVITLVPGIALIVRRYHDINKSGWNYLFILIPFVGWIVVLVDFCTKSVNENNKYDEKSRKCCKCSKIKDESLTV